MLLHRSSIIRPLAPKRTKDLGEVGFVIIPGWLMSARSRMADVGLLDIALPTREDDSQAQCANETRTTR